MSATIAIAKETTSDRVFHINDVDKTIEAEFKCCDCKQKLSPVKTEARKKDWHFRHQQTADITQCRSTALHDFAVQVIMDNVGITISKKLQIPYSEPRKEVIVFGKRSDVTVKYKNEDVHFEVFVTHDLDKEKVNVYKTNKVKCVRIDLSEPQLLNASPQIIKEAVLNQYKNKTVVYWQDETAKPYELKEFEFNWKHLLITIGVFIGLRFLYNQFLKRKN